MNNVPQTGLIILPPKPSDYKMGGETAIPMGIRLISGDWRPYKPTREAQYNYSFDTLSCTTFSALNIIETQIKYMIVNKMISDADIRYLELLGYLDAGWNINFSDRFTAIKSGTSIQGNDFVSVWDSIRKDGLLPEKDLPFGDCKNFTEYHDKSVITLEMEAKAKAIFKIFDFMYEWVTFDNNPDWSSNEITLMRTGLLQSPLHIAIPIEARHAVEMVAFDADNSYRTFDTYPPYDIDRPFSFPIHYSMKGLVVYKETLVLARTMKLGHRGDDVKRLQQILKELGFYSHAICTGYFGSITEMAVKSFQKAHKLVSDGIVGPKTLLALNSPVSENGTSTKLNRWCKAIEKHEGYFVGSRSYRNRNPGNLKFIGQKRATGKDAGGFAVFASYEDGFQELKDMLVRACKGESSIYKPTMTLTDFFRRYAPSSDDNDPDHYAKTVADYIGVPVSTQIKDLLE